MIDARRYHENLVEDVNSILVDGFGFRTTRDMAEDIIACIFVRLHGVTPEMVEAWLDIEPEPNRLDDPLSAAQADWRAMLAASPLNGGK